MRGVFTVVLAVVATIGACGLVEVALRVAYRSPPGLHFSVRPPIYRPDPELGYALRPGARLVWRTREFVERDAINGDGFRDESTPATDGDTLVLAVGDSFTFGSGVQMRESYPKVLQRLLRDAGRSVRVINAGVPGYGMDQTFKLVSHHGAALRPDLVLVGVQCSDVFDAFDVPLYDVRDGRLIELDATKTYPFVQGRLAELAPRVVARSFTFAVVLAGGLGRDPFGQRPVATVSIGDWAREKIRLEVLELQRQAAHDRFTVMVLLMPCLERLDSGAIDPYGSLASDLARAGVPVVDTLPPMRAFVPDARRLFFAENRHLNAEGNRVLATVVARVVDAPTDEARRRLGR